MKRLLTALLFVFPVLAQVTTSPNNIPVNAQTGTSYTFVNSDCGSLVTLSNASAIAVTLPQATAAGNTAFAAGCLIRVYSLGAGTVTITPTTSTINGAATLTLTKNKGVEIFSDGTNYQIWASVIITLQALVPGTSFNLTSVAAPGTPNSGVVNAWMDSTNLVWESKDANGTVTRYTGAIAAGDINLTAQTAAIANSTALFTPQTTGLYRVSYYSKITTAATTSSILGGTVGFQVLYTDGTDSVAQTAFTLPEDNQSGTALSVGTGNTTNTTQAVIHGSAVLYMKTGVAVTYGLGYTSVGATPMAFELHVRVELMQ